MSLLVRRITLVSRDLLGLTSTFRPCRGGCWLETNMLKLKLKLNKLTL